MELLSHVVFGDLPFIMTPPTQDEICQQFLQDCPGSPCLPSSEPTAPIETIDSLPQGAVKEEGTVVAESVGENTVSGQESEDDGDL